MDSLMFMINNQCKAALRHHHYLHGHIIFLDSSLVIHRLRHPKNLFNACIILPVLVDVDHTFMSYHRM